MKKITAIFCVAASVFTTRAAAQNNIFNAEKPTITYEGGVSLDGMNCLTDIGGGKGTGKKFFKDVNLGYMNVAAGIFFEANYRNYAGIRLEGTLGKVSAADRVLAGVTDIAKERFNRNINFQSRISEVALLADLYVVNIFIDASKDPKFSPYLTGGIGYFSFNPRAKLRDRKVYLRPLHTEGEGFAEFPQRKEYSLNQFNLPLGLGVKYRYNSQFSFRAEFIYRNLHTDYLDDVSTTYIDPALFDKYLSPADAADAKALSDRQIIQKVGNDGKRGSPSNDDGYFTFNLKAVIAIGRHG